ncbi:hypothetical protein PY254_00025 [Rhodanobacter sp. AS-Z3]|uniref:Tse2 family ADP-ribosyltransferase toxin n=1 Tax=Rhodanobacter sp. AS-Z3 TaxID=3031330 RepID=UPI00247AD151|nr:hypothetical protein [Rhodanobacter sp. AS-Z3]WEN15108.1 hypothetical protein PY254_00025 [Rhodanobacter sp. AS-Z3]
MSDELRRIYTEAGKADRFWETATPVDLWRAQKNTDYQAGIDALSPHLGNETRVADVKIVDRDGKRVVLGCRCIKGDFRGVSTFDMKVTWFGSRTTKHFKIPAGTAIPPGIAVTKDHKNAQGAYHYTIAPKDDMPLALFLECLGVVCGKTNLQL